MAGGEVLEGFLLFWGGGSAFTGAAVEGGGIQISWAFLGTAAIHN